MAEQIHKTKEEAQEIIDKFYGEFPSVKTWVETTIADAHKRLYVEDLWGRRRNLPDLALPKYKVTSATDQNTNFNPLLGCNGQSAWLSRMSLKYLPLLESARSFQEQNKIKAAAKAEGVSLASNIGFINRAERQSINARIQGGAASMSKRAIAAIYRDPEMQRLGFRLLLMVHDELIGECPQQHAERCCQRLSELMSDAGKPEVTLPMKCDAVCFSRWYLDEYADSLCEKWDAKRAQGETVEQLWSWVLEQYCESEPQQLKEILGDRLNNC